MGSVQEIVYWRHLANTVERSARRLSGSADRGGDAACFRIIPRAIGFNFAQSVLGYEKVIIVELLALSIKEAHFSSPTVMIVIPILY